MPVRFRPRPIRWPLRTLLGVLLVAGFVHVTTILRLSHAAGSDAYRGVATLGQDMPLKTFAGPPRANRLLPYRDPAMAVAFCLFDLTHGPVRVSLPVTPLDFAALSVHGADGRVRYGLTNGIAVGGAITLSIGLRGQKGGGEAQGGGIPRVTLAEPQGFVAVQALADMPGQTAAAEATARRLDCQPDKP